jgi:hypothetical protein
LCARRYDDVRQPSLSRDSRRISAPVRTTQRRSTRGSGARFSRRRGARARSAPAEASLGAVGGVRVDDPPPRMDGSGRPGDMRRGRRDRALVYAIVSRDGFPLGLRAAAGCFARLGWGDPRRYSLHVRPGPRLDMPARPQRGAGTVAGSRSLCGCRLAAPVWFGAGCRLAVSSVTHSCIIATHRRGERGLVSNF